MTETLAGKSPQICLSFIHQLLQHLKRRLRAELEFSELQFFLIRQICQIKVPPNFLSFMVSQPYKAKICGAFHNKTLMCLKVLPR